MKDNLIRPSDYCLINTDKFEENEGVKRGQRVWIAGHRALPISEEDPYTQRIKFYVHLLDKDGLLILPNMYIMDPNSLKKVGKNEAKKLKEKNSIFGEPVEETVPN